MLGVTRPIAVPVAMVVAVMLLLRWRRRAADPVAPGEYVAGAFALVASGVGAVAWPLIAWQVTGVRSAYTDTMAAWRVGGEITPFKPWLGMSQWAFRDFDGGNVYGPVALAALATTIVVLTCGPWATRLGPELRAWCLAYPAYLAVVLDPFTSIFRYAIPLFPLIAGGPRRRAVARARRAVAVDPRRGPRRRRHRRAGPVDLEAARLRPAIGLPAVTVTGLRAVVTSQGRSAVGKWALRRPVVFLLVVYAVTRVLAFVAMWVAATWFQTPAGVGHLDPTVGDILGGWDSIWYERVATQGYPVPLPADPDTGLLTYSAWAFYPAFPILVRGLMVTGVLVRGGRGGAQPRARRRLHAAGLALLQLRAARLTRNRPANASRW